MISPWNESDISQWREHIDRYLPDNQQEPMDGLSDHLVSMTNGLGDGLVTVESTRYPVWLTKRLRAPTCR